MIIISPSSVLNKLPQGDFRSRCQALCVALRKAHTKYDWIGLYWVDGDRLVLGPWVGDQPTEHTRIPIAQGICGVAVREEQTIIVDDVHSDPRYLSCFTHTKSEIVVPIYADGLIVGEIDIDGKNVADFDASDQKFLEEIAQFIGREWPGRW
ncbi:MAG: GAF domain-containing protein [bacterium]|nr:GAF domain-containing protein [bacterium]